jgi:DNA-binding MarR family transcriptional regulator
MGKDRRQGEGVRDLGGVDRVVHEPARLMILMYLYGVKEADALFLLNATELTWGNLSSHVSKLEEAGYVEVDKGFVGKKPRTMIRLTSAGRKAVDAYRHTMQSALKRPKAG